VRFLFHFAKPVTGKRGRAKKSRRCKGAGAESNKKAAPEARRMGLKNVSRRDSRREDRLMSYFWMLV
jgi:hypothetical protein